MSAQTHAMFALYIFGKKNSPQAALREIPRKKDGPKNTSVFDRGILPVSVPCIVRWRSRRF